MEQLISKEEVHTHIKRIIEASNYDSLYNQGFVDGLEFCANTIFYAPTIDPVIRCKYCCHCDWEEDRGYCKDQQYRIVTEHDYCSNAERKIKNEFI